jgi:hypothetical protein
VLNIIIGFGMIHYLNDFEVLIWSRMNGKLNPMESHHHFRPIHKKSRKNHAMAVRAHAERLEELRMKNGTDSTEYRKELRKIHNEINSIIDEHIEEDAKVRSSTTKVVPISDRSGIRKVVSVVIHDGPHKGHEVRNHLLASFYF